MAAIDPRTVKKEVSKLFQDLGRDAKRIEGLSFTDCDRESDINFSKMVCKGFDPANGRKFEFQILKTPDKLKIDWNSNVKEEVEETTEKAGIFLTESKFK